MPDVMLYLPDGSACRCHWDETALIGDVRVALLADQDRKIVRIMPIHECKGIGIASPKGTDPAGYRTVVQAKLKEQFEGEPCRAIARDLSTPVSVLFRHGVGLAPGVKARMDLAEPAQLDPRVDLRRGNRRVAEHFLHDAEIGSPGKQVGGEAVP